MPTLSHKFRDHVIDPKTEVLIIGTFNPDIPEGPDFFYGRQRNFLWQLLPQCYGLLSLKQADLEAKKTFMQEYHIDFADLMATVDVDAGQENNVNDTYIDGRVQTWKEIKPIVDSLPALSAVFFTRITFGGVPHIKREILDIRDHVRGKGLYFACLKTPARFAGMAKQQFWNSRVMGREPCLAF